MPWRRLWNDMNLSIASVGKECVGCGNCENCCPRSAVSMKMDEEGFLYPKVNEEKCIHCGLCRENCPQLCVQQKCEIQEGFIAISRDRERYKSSASGGIFSSIAAEFLREEHAYVCGAAYVEGQVRHILIHKKWDLHMLQGSKYVQSDLGKIFLEIKGVLEMGAKVLFSGTPCQVAALKAYIGEDRKKLYTVDLICHGVPSPLFLKKDLELYAKGKNIKNVQFRKKHKFYKSKSYFFLTVERERGRQAVVPYNRDPYFNLHMLGQTYRTSCYSCHYANLNRIGDITIGDCDSSMLYPNFHKNEATSTLIANTGKGKKLLHVYGGFVEKEPMDIMAEAEKNHSLAYAVKQTEQRSEIYRDMKCMNAEELRNKYAKPNTVKGQLYQFFNLVLPPGGVLKMFAKIKHIKGPR